MISDRIESSEAEVLGYFKAIANLLAENMQDINVNLSCEDCLERHGFASEHRSHTTNGLIVKHLLEF